jgi:hypothetical protein
MGSAGQLQNASWRRAPAWSCRAEAKTSLKAGVTDLGKSAVASVTTNGDDEATPNRPLAAALATWGRVDGCVDLRR